METKLIASVLTHPAMLHYVYKVKCVQSNISMVSKPCIMQTFNGRFLQFSFLTPTIPNVT